MTVTPARLAELLDAYHDGSLAPAGAAELEAELVASAEARWLFWECAHQHALLAELLAEARGRRLAAQEAAAVLASSEAPRRRRRAGWAPWAAAAALLALALAWALRPAGEPAGVARLTDLRGEVRVRFGEAWSPARAGQALRPGQELHTGPGGFAVLAYDDESRLELNAETAVRLPPRQKGDAAARHVVLVHGVVSATVAAGRDDRPLVLSTPHGDLIAPRGRFSSASLGGELRVELEEGQARLDRGGEAPVEIHTGTYTVAAPGLKEVGPSPLPARPGEPIGVLEAPAGPVHGLAPSPDGGRLASTSPTGEVHVWGLAQRRISRTLSHPAGKAVAVAWSRDGRHLAAGFEPRKGERNPGAVVWDTKRFEPAGDLPLRARVGPIAFTPDGLSLAMAAADRAGRGVYLWDIADRRERLVLGGRMDRPSCLAVSPDGRRVAAGYRDGQVVLWSPLTGRSELARAAHARDVQSLAFSPNGRLLASGGGDGVIRLWSLPRGEEVRAIRGAFKEVRCLAFSRSGQVLASGHGGTAVLWDAATGRQREALRAHKFAVTALVFLRDDRALASAGWDRFIKLWAVTKAAKPAGPAIRPPS